jgi:EmrB/QacA subfamily drug resistance transporter
LTEAAAERVPTDASDRIDPYVWRVAIVVVLGSIMSIFDTTIVNVALQTLHERLHSPISDVQWVITGYLLSLATVIPLTGWASRRFGAKKVYLVSLTLFTLGSALCGLAASTNELILFRVLQGVGGGMIMPVGQLILADTAGPKAMGRVISITGVPTMLGPVLGPTIGGLILSTGSWRLIFYVNLPIGILAMFLALRILPASGLMAKPPRLDVRGLALMATALPLLTYGLAEIGITHGFSSAKVLVPIIASAILLPLFVWHALGAKNPLLDLRLYRRSTYASASLVMFFLGGALFGAIILLPLYFQQLRGESVIDTGLLLGPQGLGMALVMPFVGRLVDKVGGGPLAFGGVLITLVAGVPLALIGAHTSLVWLSVVQFVRGTGIGLAFMPAFVAAGPPPRRPPRHPTPLAPAQRADAGRRLDRHRRARRRARPRDHLRRPPTERRGHRRRLRNRLLVGVRDLLRGVAAVRLADDVGARGQARAPRRPAGRAPGRAGAG